MANPIYDWGDVAGRSFRMAKRITGRPRVLVPRTMSPMRLAEARTLCQPEVMPTHVAIDQVAYEPDGGRLDLADLRAKLGDDVAAVYWENPGYLGTIEDQGAEIVRLAHEAGALAIAGVDPITLGVLTAARRPGRRHRLRRHPAPGHAHARRRRLLGLHRLPRRRPGVRPGVPARALHACWPPRRPASGRSPRRCPSAPSYGARDQGKDWVGTASGLWTIAAAVYMTVMGPRGFDELGETCIARSHYAARRLAELPGVETRLSPAFFKEFVVNFDGAHKTVAEVNEGLLEHAIFGGKDLSAEFPELGQSALYCVTEYHSEADIVELATALKEVLS